MHRIRPMLALPLALVAIAIAAEPTAAATKTALNTNLVKNPSAEAGSYSSDGSAGVLIPGWHTSANSHFTVVRYGTAGFPAKAQNPNMPKPGAQFFYSGLFDSTYSECDSAYQVIKLHGRGPAIDAGTIGANVSVWTANGSASDTATVTVTFSNATGGFLSGYGFPNSDASGVFSHWLNFAAMPVGTRQITIDLSDPNQVGPCKAYFDKVSVKLQTLP